MGEVFAISVSAQKGTRKKNVPAAEVKEDYGIVGDAHAGAGSRQVSLLSLEDIEQFRGRRGNVQPGDFAENITTRGIDLMTLTVGDRLNIGERVVLEISQIGKECHSRCEIAQEVGACLMPQQGVFARVIQGGLIACGQSVSLNSVGHSVQPASLK